MYPFTKFDMFIRYYHGSFLYFAFKSQTSQCYYIVFQMFHLLCRQFHEAMGKIDFTSYERFNSVYLCIHVPFFRERIWIYHIFYYGSSIIMYILNERKNEIIVVHR